jgi:hypothetical protein
MCNVQGLVAEFTERYRPIDIERLLAFAGVRQHRLVAPELHQFAIEFASDQAACRGDERLRAMCVDGQPVLSVARSGLQIAGSCIIASVLESSTQVECDADHHWSREDFFRIFRATP